MCACALTRMRTHCRRVRRTSAGRRAGPRCMPVCTAGVCQNEHMHVPGDGKQDREEGRREAHGAVHQARIEIHVGIELALHKVLVRQRRILQCHSHLDERVAAGDGEHFLCHLRTCNHMCVFVRACMLVCVPMRACISALGQQLPDGDVPSIKPCTRNVTHMVTLQMISASHLHHDVPRTRTQPCVTWQCRAWAQRLRAHLLDDLGPGVKVAVHAMPKAKQPLLLGLDARDEGRDVLHLSFRACREGEGRLNE